MMRKDSMAEGEVPSRDTGKDATKDTKNLSESDIEFRKVLELAVQRMYGNDKSSLSVVLVITYSKEGQMQAAANSSGNVNPTLTARVSGTLINLTKDIIGNYEDEAVRLMKMPQEISRPLFGALVQVEVQAIDQAKKEEKK